MAMNYPDKLMGWVRAGDKVYEVRLQYEPNLFNYNRYVMTQVYGVDFLPLTWVLDEGITIPVRSVVNGVITFLDGFTLNKYREVLVKDEAYNGRSFKLWQDETGVRLRLKAVPPNIR